jgi:hypothetical protein
MQSQVARNPGDTPSRIRQADHFEPVTRRGRDPRFPGTALELPPLVISEGDAIHTASIPENVNFIRSST